MRAIVTHRGPTAEGGGGGARNGNNRGRKTDGGCAIVTQPRTYDRRGGVRAIVTPRTYDRRGGVRGVLLLRSKRRTNTRPA